jgi:hypothetical protein
LTLIEAEKFTLFPVKRGLGEGITAAAYVLKNSNHILKLTRDRPIYRMALAAAALVFPNVPKIGNGKATLRREALVLRRLGNLKISGIALPRLVKSGLFKEPVSFDGRRFVGYQLITRAPGRAASDFEMLWHPGRWQARFAESLAGTLAKFHEACSRIKIPVKRMQDSLIMRAINLAPVLYAFHPARRELMGDLKSYIDRRVALLEEKQADRPLVGIHGDPNPGNMLVNKRGSILSIIDLAETHRTRFPETEFAMLGRVPGLLPETVDRYIRHSPVKIDQRLTFALAAAYNFGRIAKTPFARDNDMAEAGVLGALERLRQLDPTGPWKKHCAYLRQRQAEANASMRPIQIPGPSELLAL